MAVAMVTRTQVLFEVSGKTLAADILAPEGRSGIPFVLFLLGPDDNSADVALYARTLARRGFGTFTVELNGQSLVQAKAAYDACFGLPQAEATQLFAMGSSDRGYLAALLAAQRPLAGVVMKVQMEDKTLNRRVVTALRKSQVPVLVLPEDAEVGDESTEAWQTLRRWLVSILQPA
jgi:hypothetical protein